MNLEIWTNCTLHVEVSVHRHLAGTNINIGVDDDWAKKIIDQMCGFFGEDTVMKMVKDEI